MPNSTSNFGWNLPLVNNATDADLWGGQLNSNWSSLDTTLKTIQDANLPVGTMIDYAGTSTPSLWLDCDGSAVSRATYSDLFTAISTTWGVGDGSTTFNIPDFQRRVAVGSGGSGTGTLGNSVGDTGGGETESISISASNLPSSLTLTQTSTGDADNTQQGKIATAASGARTLSSSISLGGSGSAISADIMQPSAVVSKIIYAGV